MFATLCASGINGVGAFPFSIRVFMPNTPLRNFKVLSICCIKSSTVLLRPKSRTKNTLNQIIGAVNGNANIFNIRKNGLRSLTIGNIVKRQKPDPSP